jgi:hypothetical protein
LTYQRSFGYEQLFQFQQFCIYRIQKLADEIKVEQEALLEIKNELSAAAEYFKDHGHDFGYVNISVLQTFLNLFIFLLSFQLVSVKTRNINFCNKIFARAPIFVGSFINKILSVKLFVSLLFEEQGFYYVCVIVNVGELTTNKRAKE